MGDAADLLSDPRVLRLENLDTDLAPPAQALAASVASIHDDDANSYLPFFGHNALRQAATALVARLGGLPPDAYDWRRQCFISAGGLSGVLNALLACIDPGDEVILTSPTYVGLINRVRLAGGVPRFVPLRPGAQGWRLDLQALRAALGPRTRAFLMMSPSMPSGAVLDAAEWRAVSEACVDVDAWMIYDAAMERLLFDGAPHIHPAGLPGMRERTVSIGALSKEYRMIGWRVGWVVCPPALSEALARVSLSNVVTPVGIAQPAATAAILADDDGITACTAEWQARRDLLLSELQGDFAVVRPQGGWSLLIDMAPLGSNGREASRALLERAQIAATSMENWGLPDTSRYLRLVFANEPLARLVGIGARMRAALKA
ncbi:MAG: pyridoxal phosphate-dependent aminotransferase [Pseudomonadota bacterium]